MKLTLVVAVFLLLWCLTIQCWNCAVPNLCRIFLLTCHPSIFYVEPLHNTMLSFSFHSIVDTTDVVILIYICFVKQNINVVIYCILKFVSYFILYITTQCKLYECKWSICASDWKEKHHLCKVQWVIITTCK